MADKAKAPAREKSSAELESEKTADIQAAITLPEAPRAEPSPARDAELARQAAVTAAVHDATHDAKGEPIPLGVADHLPRPDGIRIVEGKP